MKVTFTWDTKLFENYNKIIMIFFKNFFLNWDIKSFLPSQILKFLKIFF